MNFELKTLDLASAALQPCDLLVALVADDAPKASDALSTLIAHAQKNGDFEAKTGKSLAMYAVPAITARHLLLLGVGDASAKSVRKALAGVAGQLTREGIKQVAIATGSPLVATALDAAVQCLADAGYQYSTTKPSAKAIALQSVVIGAPNADSLADAFAQAQATAAGVAFAREWANRPANYATPKMLADAAESLADGNKRIKCKIHKPEDVAKLGMGAFMAVAQGSAQPLRFIELHYSGADKSVKPIVLVGKGITFDTGGISLKPAPDMDEMKYDMGGAASVLGTFRALSDLKPAVNVVGLIPACENMPDGQAVKPGDVVTSMSGQTIEILNTDAEGRLVLCDVLHYATRFEPAAIVDIATLTGACVIALGGQRSGLFANNDDLALALQTAGDQAQDTCWRMPLDEEYAEGLKSNFADVANVAGRPGGAITAAKFLQRFVGNTPWAHLDVAGTAWKGGAKKGATGRPVGLLLQYLLASEGVVAPASAKTKVDKAPKAVKTAKAAKPGKAATNQDGSESGVAR
ncbi:MAG: leucyl aminopeptidase [Comamonas sp.]